MEFKLKPNYSKWKWIKNEEKLTSKQETKPNGAIRMCSELQSIAIKVNAWTGKAPNDVCIDIYNWTFHLIYILYKELI